MQLRARTSIYIEIRLRIVRARRARCLSASAGMAARESDSLLGRRSLFDDNDDDTIGDGLAATRGGDREQGLSLRDALRQHRWVVLGAVLGVAAFAAVCTADLGFGDAEFKTQAPAQRCLALLLLVATLWASEIIPAHVTSLLVPLLAVLLRVLCVPRHVRERSETDTLLVPAYMCNSTDPAPGHPMPASAAASVAVGAFFNPLILLFLAGFSMSIVFDQRGISHQLAAALLRRLGTSPATVGLGLMVCCVLASAVLGNVSAAVIATSLLRPTLMDEEIQRTSWPRFALLGVAYASNIGGMLSPVASPQNLIALMAIQSAAAVATPGSGESGGAAAAAAGAGGAAGSLSFGAWVGIALPFCSVLLLLCWGFLLAVYRKDLPRALPPITIDHARPGHAGGGTLSTAFVVGVAMLTIFLWVIFDEVAHIFGHIGIVGLIPIVCFGACGYITKVDFNAMPWVSSTRLNARSFGFCTASSWVQYLP